MNECNTIIFGLVWAILDHLFKMIFNVHCECVSFYTSFDPILTLPVPPDCFIVALPVASVSSRIWLSPGASIICHHALSTLLYPISLSLWG